MCDFAMPLVGGDVITYFCELHGIVCEHPYELQDIVCEVEDGDARLQVK